MGKSRRRRVARLLLALGVLFAAAEPAASQEFDEAERWSIATSIGFTADPGAFQLTVGLPYSASRSFRVGPLLQLAFADDLVIVAPTANFQYAFDVPGSNPQLRRLRPYLQLGLGFAYIDKNQRWNDDEVGFLLNPGFGAEYAVTESIAVGSNVLFNVLPVTTTGENFFFSWQVGSVRFLF
jgi:hypothetical protein